MCMNDDERERDWENNANKAGTLLWFNDSIVWDESSR